ncbi:MAG: spore coat protein GerQ [Defluviitaleaceae bacterium]|nr:spore coat protein GerQ [Defluviitaleaceae bacterium]
MSYFPPFYPYPFPLPYGNEVRNPMTIDEYAKAFEPPYPSGHHIGAGTPTGPAGLNKIVAASTEDALIDNFINRSSGRGNGGGYIDNILRFNRGKLARIRMTFNSGGNTSETKVFTGLIETAARDHIILSDPQTGGRFLLLMIYLDYIEFPEEVNYFYPGTNTLNVADEKMLVDHPEVMPLYHYQKAKQERFIHHLEAVALKQEEGK